MANLAEQLKKEMNNDYKNWLSRYEEKLRTFTSSSIKDYGKAYVYCNAFCNNTYFGCCGSVLPSERAFLEKWLEENGFRHYESCNGHGARMIVWTL